MTDFIERLVGELILTYKGCFSDICSKEILNFDLADFKRAYLVSEGLRNSTSLSGQEKNVRALILQKLESQIDDNKSELEKICTAENVCLGENYLEKVFESLYFFEIVQKLLIKYVKNCSEELKNILKQCICMVI